MKQIPLVYENTVTSLDGAPLGSLPDALECKVTEERHGDFFCEMLYPAYGLNADLIRTGRIIAVQPNMYDNIQGFRIATIEKTLEGEMTVTAYHVSYDLAQVIVMPFTAANISDALDGLETYAVPSNAFSFETDKSTVATFAVTEPAPLRSLLVGTQGSLVDVYGGELKFDNWTVSLLASRGQDRNVHIAYAKNLTGFKEVNENGKYDAVVPFANYNDTVYMLTDTTVCATAPIVYADAGGGTYGYPKAMPLDLSDKFESETEPTQALLYQYATQYIARNSGSPTVNMSTEYVDLAKVMGNTERVDLCDTVYISVQPYNVWNVTSKVIKIVYDVLLDENAEVEIGDRRITLADTLAKTIAEAEAVPAATPGGGGDTEHIHAITVEVDDDVDVGGDLSVVGNVSINGTLTMQGHAGSVGQRLTNQPSADVSLTAQTGTTATAVASVSLTPGLWIVFGYVLFSSASNSGRRSVSIASASGQLSARIRQSGYITTSAEQQLECSGYLNVTQTTTYYLNAQSSRACNALHSYSGIYAVRIL